MFGFSRQMEEEIPPSLQAGEIWHLPSKARPNHSSKSIRFASFNVERGYHASAIHDFIVDKRFDVVCLQEVDIGCLRTQRRNNVQVVAGGENFDGVYAVEFEE